MYALFEGDKQIGSAFPTEKQVWEAALIEGLVMDVPVADEEGGQVIPRRIPRRQGGRTLRSPARLESPRDTS